MLPAETLQFHEGAPHVCILRGKEMHVLLAAMAVRELDDIKDSRKMIQLALSQSKAAKDPKKWGRRPLQGNTVCPQITFSYNCTLEIDFYIKMDRWIEHSINMHHLYLLWFKLTPA